ncbi:hypothetical protein A2U01_0067996, partial [Trifolium medium]|nr:hypothetical protein [Trifolium medium]
MGVENPILYSLPVTTVYLVATRLSLAASSLFPGTLSWRMKSNNGVLQSSSSFTVVTWISTSVLGVAIVSWIIVLLFPAFLVLASLDN